MTEKQKKYVDATAGWKSAKYSTVAECAHYFGVDRTILHHGLITQDGNFPGKGNSFSVLSLEEEKRIADHIVYMSEIGFGASWLTLRLLLQEALLALKAACPGRVTGYENSGHLPNLFYAWRFAAQHCLTLLEV